MAGRRGMLPRRKPIAPSKCGRCGGPMHRTYVGEDRRLYCGEYVYARARWARPSSQRPPHAPRPRSSTKQSPAA